MSPDLRTLARASRTAQQVKWFANHCPEEFRRGYRFGFRGEADPPCDAAGYPHGFHTGPLAQRNAWWAGWNCGRVAVDYAAALAGGADG